MFIPVEKYYTSETGEELFLEFDCDVTPSSENYYSNHYGNWLPGDSAEVKITAIRFNGEPLTGEAFDCFYKMFSESVIEKALKDAERAA